MNTHWSTSHREPDVISKNRTAFFNTTNNVLGRRRKRLQSSPVFLSIQLLWFLTDITWTSFISRALSCTLNLCCCFFFSGSDYIHFLCCHLNEMPVESAASAAPFQPPDTYRLAYLQRTHTYTQIQLLLRGQQKGLFLWGERECWNQPHERIANYGPLGHTQ